jgi:hypothetical protein
VVAGVGGSEEPCDSGSVLDGAGQSVGNGVVEVDPLRAHVGFLILTVLAALRLVLDSRGDRDRLDVRTVQKILAPYSSNTRLVYEHTYSQLEPLIWVADLTGWAHGVGGGWRRRIAPAIAKTIECTFSDSAKPGRRPSGR